MTVDGPYRPCGNREHGNACDRPVGHDGACSSKLAELSRLRQDYASAIAELSRTRHEIVVAESHAAHLERELNELRRRSAVPRRWFWRR